MDTPNRKENIAKLLGFLKQNGYASKGLSLEGLDTRLQNDSLRRDLYNALSRDKVPDIGSWNEFSSMVKKEKDSTAQAQPSTRAGSTSLVPNSPLLPSPNKTNKNTISTDWTRPTPQFSIPTSERNPGVPTLVPSRKHPYVGRELAFVSPAEVTNLNTGKKHYDASKTSVIYPDEIGEDNTRKAIDNYTQAKASEANRLDRKIEAQLQDIEKKQKELRARLDKRDNELEAEREGEGWFVKLMRDMPNRLPNDSFNATTNNGKYLDDEYNAYLGALADLNEQKKKLLSAKKSAQEDDSFGSFLKDGGRGFVDTFTNPRTWDSGVLTARESRTLFSAIGKRELQEKFNSGKATKKDTELLRTLYNGELKLTPSEEALLNSKAGLAYVNAITKEVMGYGYGAGETTASMLPFIAEILLSPTNGAGKAVATSVAKSALKSGLSRVATKAISRTARVVSDIALDGAGTALTTGIGRTFKGAADEQIGDIKYDVDSKTGQIVYGGRTNQEENFLKAFGKSLVRQALEYGTEATGGAYIGTLMKPINKYGGKLLTKTLGDKAVSAVEKFFARMEKTSVGKAVNSVGEQVHYDGLPGEYLEEVYNNLLNAVTIGDMKLDTNSNNGVFNPEINKTIIIGLMGAPMATVSLKVGSIVAQDTKTQAMGLRAFGYKQWQEMKTLIGNSDDVSKTISEWAEQNPNATSNQKKAVMRYAVATAMEDAMTVRQALEQKERKKDSATTLTPSQTAEQSGGASAVAPNPSSSASESADNTSNPNSDNSKRYEQGNGVILKREDGTSVRAQIVSEENEDGKIEVASSEGAIQGRDRVVYLTREELDQMYQGSFDIDTPDASSNEKTQLSDTSIDSTPASPTPNSDSPIGRPMTEEEAVSFVDKMTAEAEEAPELELTAENWDREFGDNGVVDTPIGQVHMGEHQFLKMMRQGRNSKLGMIKPTLTNPDIIIEVTSQAKEGQETERASSHVYVKAFTKPNGERFYYFTSISVQKDSAEVVISNQERSKGQIAKIMKDGSVLWMRTDNASETSDVAQGLYSPQGNQLSDPTSEGTVAPQSLPSEDKDTTLSSPEDNTHTQDGTDTTQEGPSNDTHSEERSEEHEWDELSKQVGEESAREIINSDISDLEEERKKLQKEISKPKGQTREEKIQYVIGRRERLQSIDAEIEGLQRVLQVPQMRIAQADTQEQEQNRIKAKEARRQEEHTDNQGNPTNEDGTLKTEEVQNVDELTDEDFTDSSRNSKKFLDAGQNSEGKVENEDERKSEDNSTEGIRFRRSQELEEVNDRFNEQLQAQIDGTLPKGHVYSLGMPSAILKSAGIPNLPIELSAERLEKKASIAYSSLHPFNLSDITDLPQSLANPIAVFNSRTKQGAKVILTELKDKRGNNFVVALQVRKSEHSRKMDVEVNDVRSLYPKDRVGGIIGWINQGLLTWVDKKKATEFLSTQEPNYLGGGNQFNSLSDATKVIKEFENPNIEENAFDDDILFRGRYVEGQLGYTERADGTPISDNAKYAEEAGKFPASLFKKKYGISPADFKMLNDLELIKISEWHHTGATFRETDYYSWVDNATFDDGYNSKRGYDLNGEYEYNEQGVATYAGEDENPSMPLSEWYKQNKKAIKPIADAYKAGEWTWEREDPSVGLHRIKNREDAEDRMIETHFRKEERQYRNMHWGEYPKSLKNLFSAMLKWDENAHYEDIEAEAERLANEFYDAHIEETLEADRKKVEEGEAKNRAIREKNLSSASKETALMALAKLYGMNEQEAYNKISSSSWYNRSSLRRRSTSSDEASERNPLHAEMEREATSLAHSMGEEVVVVHNEEELVDILGEDGARQARGAKGFYLPKSGKVVIILSNNTDVADILETIFHEFVGHKGLQEYVGKEEFTAFIDRVHKGLPSKVLSEVHREARTIYNERKETSRAVSYQDAIREATEEYIARVSEKGFSDRESRSTWKRIVDAFRDMISRAKLTLGWNIQDRDIRYILWKSFQMKQKQVAILAEAGDIAMRHRLGIPQKVKVTEGVRERRATSNDAGTSRYNSGMRSVSSELDNKLAITTLSPSTEIPVVQTKKRSVSTAEAKQAIESLPKQVVTMDGYALNVSKKTKRKLSNNIFEDGLVSEYKQVLTILPQVVGNSVLIEEHRDRIKIDGERKADNPNDVNIDKTQRFYGAITIGGVTYRVKTTAIVSANTEQGSRMHNYDITEIELLPSSPTANSQELAHRSNSISLAKLLNGVGFSYEPERKILDEMQGGTEGIRFRRGQEELEEVNDRFNEQLERLNEETANSTILSLGSPSNVLLSAGVADKPMRLYGNKVIKKMKKHGFSLSELRDLPRAVANPIAVFNTHRDGSHAILTEIKSNQGNILVALEVGSGGADIDFNLITSTYGKNKDKIVQWFNTGVASYIDKEKALEYLASAPAPIAGAKQAQELSSATKVIESFENPSIEEKSSDLTNGIRFRPGNNSPISWNESAAKTEYNRTTRITDENGNKSKSANWLWRLREAYQDSMLSLKALQDALAKNALGRDLRDFEDAYTAENAMGSKNLSEMEHYDARYVKPLTDAISELMKEGASYEDILNYLRAKHGLERNEYYNAQDRAAAKDKWDSKEALKQQKNPNYQPKEFEDKGEFKDYSGLTGLTGSSEDFTKLAQDMVEEFENKFNTDALWTSVRNANQKTLELGRQKNLIGKHTYEHIKGMFEYYIPLRGWDSNRAEDEWEYLDGAGTMSGNSIRKSAKGRTSVSDDPIAMMIKLAEDTIRQGNRNMMKLKFLNLAENADDKLLQYSRAWFQKKIDQEGNEYWELVTPDIDDDASPEEVSEALLEFNQNMNNLKELGEATQYPPKDSRKNITFDKNGSLGERKQHTVTVYRGGQLYTIFVNGNPRAAQAINGTINAGMYSGQIESIVGPFNRWISAMHTSYNPEFIITNAVRDFQHATFMIFAQEGLGSKYMKDFQKQYIRGLKCSLGLYKRWRSGTLDLSSNEDKMFHDFMINGGQTGYTQISKIEDLKKKVEWELKKAKGEAGRMKVGFEILQEGLELFNGAIELNTRFATFVASRKSGRSIERSISDAKNITVNFNKKGAGGYGAAFFQALYIFFNPAVQALEQSVRVSRKHPKRVAAMIGTMATLAYLQPILFELIGAAAGGDDDDEDAYDNINQNSRLSSLIIRNPLDTSTYINLPISPELKPFFTLGSALAEAQRGAMTPSEATGQILQGMTSLLPLDPAGGNGDKKWINIVPSVVQPLEQVAVNTNYYGESIYKDNSFNKLDPEWTKAKDANPIFTKTSEILNEWSGGNKVRKGEIDINPEKVEHIVEGFTGGAGRATNALFKTFMMPFDSDMRKLNNTVMLRKFYKAIPQAKEGMLSPIIWKISDQFKDIEHEKNGYRKELQSNDPSEVSEYAQKLYDLKLSSEYNFYIRYRRSIDRLQDLRKKYKEANTDEGRKGISDLMNSIQERVLKAYKEEQQTE